MGTLVEKYLKRFDHLIEQGDALLGNMLEVRGDPVSYNIMTGITRYGPNKKVVKWRDFVQWRTNSIALLSQVIPDANPLRENISTFQSLKNHKGPVDWGLGILAAVREDFENGFIDDLMNRAQEEIATDYMAQADALLQNDVRGRKTYIAAGVLAGAVLEKELRILSSEITTDAPYKQGGRKTLNPLIDQLKGTGVFNEAKAKQLRAWAAIRNHAAHGEFDQFDQGDVVQMVAGVNQFLADYSR